jgi:tRNA pseudouridine32 synthase/23S rRNA pseudouridine746 synthase
VTILHEDDCIVVVEKTGGFLAVPGRGPDKQDCVVSRVRERYPGCIEQPAVHRLDMDTSGVMVLALDAAAHRELSRQFENREPEKEYVAILEGRLEGRGGTISLPFRLDVDNRPIQIHDPVHGKTGVTHWENLGAEGGRTRVRFRPVTGRTHQLRVHAAHPLGLGCPIAGDPFYGSGAGPGRLMLHASLLAFHHPGTGRRVRFVSPPPF